MSPLGIVLLIIVLLLIFGGIGPNFYSGLPYRPYYGVHPGGFSIVAVILVVLVIWLLLGRGGLY